MYKRQVLGGGGGSGTAGTNGNSVTFIFREVMSGGATPTTPPRTEGSYVGGNFNTAPNDWHLTASAAEAHLTGDGDLYLSVVKLDGDGSTIISYGNPVKITGPRGPPGDSTAFVYRISGTLPPAPSGGTFISGTFTPPPDWELNVSRTLVSGEDLYLSEATLPGEGTSPTVRINYKTPFRVPRGEQGPRGIQGEQGPQGAGSTVPGPAGIGFTIIFREAMNEPSIPTGGTWDGSTFRAPSGWLRNSPTRSVNDPENLYASGVELPSGGGTVTYTGIYQLNGEKGEAGDRGLMGFRGIGNEIIFQVSSTMPVRPTSGSGIWDAETDAYTCLLYTSPSPRD